MTQSAEALGKEVRVANTLFLIANLQAKPGQEDLLGAELEAMVKPSLDEPGCLAYRPYVDPHDAGAYVIVEEWKDKEALYFHFETPHFQKIAGVLDDLLAEPLTIRLLNMVDVELPPGIEELRVK